VNTVQVTLGSDLIFNFSFFV